MFNCRSSLVRDKREKLSRSEKDIYRAWLEGNYKKSHLKTISGQNVSIISAGRRNELEGPDFLDAMVIIGGELLRGPIEIHQKNRNWYEHEHHNDPNYNAVILHVVTQCNREIEIKTENNKKIPVLILQNYDVPPVEQKDCKNWGEINTDQFLKTLKEYGQQRFNRKSLILKSAISTQDPEQVMYKGLLDVLGYSKNRGAFAKLADSLPIKEVYQFAAEFENEKKIPVMEALFLGIAGLLNRKNAKYFRTEHYYQETKKKWGEIHRGFDFDIIDNINWHFVKSRPANHPPVRILALVQIINNFLPHKLSEEWIKFITRRPDVEALYEWLDKYIQQPAGLWRNHPLLNEQPRRRLLGESRVMDLLSNYLLPFARAYGNLKQDHKLIDHAALLSQKIGRGAIPGIVRKMFKRLVISTATLENNNLLQGSIEYYRNWCNLNLCKLCPLREYAN